MWQYDYICLNVRILPMWFYTNFHQDGKDTLPQLTYEGVKILRFTIQSSLLYTDERVLHVAL